MDWLHSSLVFPFFSGETFDDFRQKMVNTAKDTNEGRYAVYDVKDDKTGHSRLLFVIWYAGEYQIVQNVWKKN